MKKGIDRRHFEILGITPSATRAEIKAAFREQMKLWHPDRFANRPGELASALERSKLINEAYKLLRNYSPPQGATGRTKQTHNPDDYASHSGHNRRPGERVHVRSTNIRWVGYDSKKQVLEVEFHNGSIYRYYDVPEQVHKDFLSADSKGKYLNRHIAFKYRSESL